MNNCEIKYNAKLFSMIGQAGSVFGIASVNFHDQYSLKILSSDMSYAAGLAKYKELYPKDFINVGIAEQNLIGIASGMVAEGLNCIAVAQACFLSMRSFEQIRQYMGYMHEKLIVVGLNSGFSLTFFGNTHYAVEDIALIRTIPNMTILSPADAGEAIKAVEAALKMNTPVYIRLSGSLNNPIVYENDFEYDPSKANVVYDSGEDIAILATGSLVYNSIKAAKMLNDVGIKAKVFDIHCIKPFDKDVIKKIKNCKLAVTAEEHSVIGGLGGAVAEMLAESSGGPTLIRIGVNDCFSTVGDYKYLMSQHGLTPERIVESIKKELA